MVAKLESDDIELLSVKILFILKRRRELFVWRVLVAWKVRKLILTSLPITNEIAMEGERLVFDKGKTNFREGKGRWHGHVSIRIYMSCLISMELAPSIGLWYTIQSPQDIMKGTSVPTTSVKPCKHAQDLAHPAKTTEMLLFLAGHLKWYINKLTWMGCLLKRELQHIALSPVRTYVRQG